MKARIYRLGFSLKGYEEKREGYFPKGVLDRGKVWTEEKTVSCLRMGMRSSPLLCPVQGMAWSRPEGPFVN